MARSCAEFVRMMEASAKTESITAEVELLVPPDHLDAPNLLLQSVQAPCQVTGAKRLRLRRKTTVTQMPISGAPATTQAVTTKQKTLKPRLQVRRRSKIANLSTSPSSTVSVSDRRFLCSLLETIPTQWQTAISDIMETIASSARSPDSAEYMRCALYVAAGGHTSKHASLMDVWTWCIMEPGQQAQHLWSVNSMRGCVTATFLCCCQCGGDVKESWALAQSVRVMSAQGCGNLLHVPSVCERCSLLMWHHACSERCWDVTARPCCERRGNMVYKNKCPVRSCLESPFVGNLNGITHIFGGSGTFAVELSVLQDYERLLYRCAVSFEGFVVTYNDRHKRHQLDTHDLRLFRQMCYRYGLLRILDVSQSLGLCYGALSSDCIRIDMAIHCTQHTKQEKTQIEDRLARTVWETDRIWIRASVRQHPACCRSLRPDLCRTMLSGDGNAKLFSVVCPVVPVENPRLLCIPCAPAVPVPCGRYPALGAACLEHVDQAPPRPRSRRTRILPRDVGKRDRVHCANNRNEPETGNVKFYVSAGMLSFSFPCGHMAGLRLMFWHESHMQVFALPRDIAEEAPEVENVAYDDMCHFAPWLRTRFRASADATARRLATDADLFIDEFHFCKGHGDPACRALYNPRDRAIFPSISTSVAEVQWHWLNRYGHIVRHMSAAHASLVLLHVSMLRNMHTTTI